MPGFGASGYVPKAANATQINEAIDKVLAGGLFLPMDMEAEDDPDHTPRRWPRGSRRSRRNRSRC